MSYNCDIFKVEKLKNLRIPMDSFYQHSRSDWHPKRLNYNDGTIGLEVCESSFITGILNNNILDVDSIECSGVGSGSAMHLIFEPALRDSTGELIVSCIWKGGDSVNRLIVKNGDVKWENIDI